MGHKVHPYIWRVGYTKSWKSSGYADKKEYKDMISVDFYVRNTIIKFLQDIPVGDISVTHSDQKITVEIYSSRTTLVLGKNGENIQNLENILSKGLEKPFSIDVKEIKNPDTHSQIIAFNVASSISRRLPYRRVVKQAVAKAMEKGAKGIKVLVSGRLNGTDIARAETYKEGNIPSQTIRANIDYSTARAETIYGTIGLKVWIYKGDIKK